jgi:acylaminoacyl-peptidase
VDLESNSYREEAMVVFYLHIVSARCGRHSILCIVRNEANDLVNVCTVIGQYPDVFSAAVIRNPVISCGEISSTDIPDWYFAEFGLPYDSTTLMTPSLYATLFAASPISYVDNVRAKVLLLLGEVDLRVAPTNSLTYYHALKGRDKVVEMLAFPKDSHPLDSVEASRISWEAGRDWFVAAQNSGE